MTTPSHLPRVLGPWMATALVIGTVIGAGIFKKPAVIAQNVPEVGLILLAWVVVGIITLFGALSLAEVAILLPRAGGNYVYLKEAYGRWAGFLWGWVEFWIIRSASIAALATVFSESLHDVLRLAQELPSGAEVLTFWQRQALTISIIVVLTLVSARGARLGGGLQVLVTAVKVLTLLAIALLPLALWLLGRELDRVSLDNLQPVWPSELSAVDWSKFGAAVVGVLWAYHGWMNVAPVAEEVRNPGRNLPLAFILGSLAVMVLYVSVNLSYHLVIPHDVMKNPDQSTVAATFFFRLLGGVGLLLASLAVMISVFGALNGNLLVGPRLLYAMGEDGLAPARLGTLHARFGTPVWAHWTLTAWSILLIVAVGVLLQSGLVAAETQPFDVLTNYAIFGAAAFETLAVAALFVLRQRYPLAHTVQPYRCALYPWLTLIYVTVFAAVLVNMFATTPLESFAALGFMLLGALFYYTCLRKAAPAGT